MATYREADISKLIKIRDDLFNTINRLYRENNNKGSTEAIITADVWGPVKDIVQEIEQLKDSISFRKDDVKLGLLSKDEAEKIIAATEKKIDKAISRGLRYRNKAAEAVTFKIEKEPLTPKQEEKQEEEKKEVKKQAVKQKEADKTFKEIEKVSEKAIEKFNARGSAIDKNIYKSIIEEIGQLETKDGSIKNTVANLRKMNSIKNRLKGIILSDPYMSDLKEFVGAFNEITKLQNQYWKTIDSNFKAGPYLKEIRIQTIQDTVKLLGETGVAGNAIAGIGDILQKNISAGGSIADLAEILRKNIVTDSMFSRSAKQVTTDAVNQYNAQYTQVVSSDLGFEWYAYRNSNIKTTRPFCLAMTELRYFHQTEIPRLLKAEGLYYLDPKTKQRKKVGIYAKTGLPEGMIEGTNAANFTILRGGYNCGHQIQPVPARNVPAVRQAEVYATPAYKRWKAAQ